MAMYVFKDEARLIKLLAKDALKEDKGVRFYCPNKDCDAKMHIRNVDGAKKSYFAASSVPGHIEGCPHHVSNSFNPNKFNELEFDFNNALLSLTQQRKTKSKNQTHRESPQGSDTQTPPRTIRQIYTMCIAHDCTDKYNGITVGQMLLYDQSLFMYPKGVFGWRIIESRRQKPKFYNALKMEITLIAPIENGTYKFLLQFTDAELYKKIQNYIYANRDYKIIVAGEWKSSGVFNEFSTTIVSDRQVAIIR